jgi:hypothetical protein
MQSRLQHQPLFAPFFKCLHRRSKPILRVSRLGGLARLPFGKAISPHQIGRDVFRQLLICATLQSLLLIFNLVCAFVVS